MDFFKVSLAGDLGSGKTTVGAILKEKFGAEVVSIGKIARKMASEMGLSIKDFNVYQETHPEIDGDLDNRLKEYVGKKGNYIFDSRMAWNFVPDAFSVYLKCDKEESARRIIKEKRGDEKYSSVNDAVEELFKRRESEKLRYKEFYGVNITDMGNYDLVVDTTGQTPEEVANEIVEKYKSKI